MLGIFKGCNDTLLKVFTNTFSQIAEGQRELIRSHSVKKRHFIGNTSMDAGLSFIMANHGKVKAHDLVYDPFVGTGEAKHSTCHHFCCDLSLIALCMPVYLFGPFCLNLNVFFVYLQLKFCTLTVLFKLDIVMIHLVIVKLFSLKKDKNRLK